MTAVFLFGTLRHPQLLSRVLDMPVQAVPAWLEDQAACCLPGEGLAMLCTSPGAVAQGLLLEPLSPEAVARLDHYAESQGLVAVTVKPNLDDRRVIARAYDAPPGTRPGAPFDLVDWVARCGMLATAAAGEVMLSLGLRSPAVNAGRRRMILARAASRLRAQLPGPATLRRGTSRGDIDERARRQPYANFFAVEEYDFRHRRFDGGWSQDMNRAAFLSGDAATVLPYDPARDTVLLIEQFRVGPYARGDSECWSIEAIAGLIDPGETPETTARREAIEEAGVEIGRLHPVHGYYTSPGAKAEFIYSYVGEAELPEAAAGLGGLACEGEDIRAHVVSLDRALGLLDSGEINNAPLILTLLWLTRNRERLRASG
ncbi:nudix-type nucleoside diphosphatase (YffH/AdpP family) [Rhodovulum bhavnagarense]|uniref:ADP-ribose pyrophosphatase n=1 Tax=Rhodovulum bhavnagarense TaxID=992286 RepID=A0A4R2RDZ3_9RHOB|nr:NUDIX domain-containing protein [Rhodovulum bhavnagarense]TCP60578.1 nudix-type nucleoside diphosphatase (YffH/AdpP family) [Rhodovulum bhavnagarense]